VLELGLKLKVLESKVLELGLKLKVLELKVLELGWKLKVNLEYLQELEHEPGVVLFLQIL
jgi:hypothetical protein